LFLLDIAAAFAFASALELAPHALSDRSNLVGEPSGLRSGPGIPPIRARKDALRGLSPAFRLPATGDTLNIRNILAIAYQALGSSKEWIPIRSYRFDGNANSTAFTSGQTVSIYDYIPSGRSVQIVYATDPTPFTTNAQEFAATTGLPESCKDLIILGATYRLLSNLDPARASMVSPQADETDSKRPYGSSQSLTRQVYALFTQRLNEEVKSQQEKYPIRVHYSL